MDWVLEERMHQLKDVSYDFNESSHFALTDEKGLYQLRSGLYGFTDSNYLRRAYEKRPYEPIMVYTVFFHKWKDENQEFLYERMFYLQLKKTYCSIVLKTTFNQFLIVRRTQWYNSLLSVIFSDLDSDWQIEKHVSSFYGKLAAWRIRSSFVTGQNWRH